MRMHRFIAGAAFLGTLAFPGIAAAANAYTTGNVNLRAGPSTNFPRVTTLPDGVTVTIHGCLRGWSWCDTSWRGERGWVSGRYLEYLYQGRRVLVPNYGTRIGLPVLSFSFGSYWDDYYSERSWYRDRPRWRQRWDSGDWDYNDDEEGRRRRDVEVYSDDDQVRRRRTTSVESDQEIEPLRTKNRQRIVEIENEDDGMSESVPRGIAKRNGKPCPPGLKKQGRCVDE